MAERQIPDVELDAGSRVGLEPVKGPGAAVPSGEGQGLGEVPLVPV